MPLVTSGLQIMQSSSNQRFHFLLSSIPVAEQVGFDLAYCLIYFNPPIAVSFCCGEKLTVAIDREKEEASEIHTKCNLIETAICM